MSIIPSAIRRRLPLFNNSKKLETFPKLLELPPELRIQTYESLLTQRNWVHDLDSDRAAKASGIALINERFGTNFATPGKRELRAETAPCLGGIEQPCWVLHKVDCDRALLRTSKQVCIEARHAINRAFRQYYSQNPSYHVSCYGYSILEMMAQMNRYRFDDDYNLGKRARGLNEIVGGSGLTQRFSVSLQCSLRIKRA
jgi:hypothetical protein